ncbi:MAG: GNAT family N-acetyltransferase [Patescibacteria group bacterium]
MITVRRITPEDHMDVNLVNQLITQLVHDRRLTTQEELNQIIADPLMRLFGAFDGDRLIGMRYGYFRRGLGRWMSSTHDLVVEEAYRGQGIGQLLTQQGMTDIQQFCNEQGESFRHYVTSNPNRRESNSLIVKLGFTLAAEAVGSHGTNLYFREFFPE